jgi:hypothetical protein
MSYISGEYRGQAALLPAAIEDYVAAGGVQPIHKRGDHSNRSNRPISAGTARPKPSPLANVHGSQLAVRRHDGGPAQFHFERSILSQQRPYSSAVPRPGAGYRCGVHFGLNRPPPKHLVKLRV